MKINSKEIKRKEEILNEVAKMTDKMSQINEERDPEIEEEKYK